MKFKVKFWSIILAILICFCNTACANKGSAVDLFYFNSDVRIETRNKPLSDADKQEIVAILEDLENKFSLSVDNSLLKKYNALTVGQELSVDEQTVQIFKQALFAQEYTDDKFNPTVYPLSRLWGFADGYPLVDFVPPTDAQIQAILDSSAIAEKDDWYDIIQSEKLSLKKLNAQTEIDLGGILKGYATNTVGNILVERGYSSGYVSVGTSSLYILSVKTLGIRHPRNSADIPSVISVNLKGEKNLNVSTSGDYEKTYMHGGKTYSHLIDSSIGKPAETGVMSATVIGADGGFSDAVTTALCLCSHSAGQGDSELIRLMQKILYDYPSAKLFVLWSNDKENHLITNQKQGKDFTLLDNSFSIVNI